MSGAAWMGLAVRAGCVIGNRRLGLCAGRVTFHHIASGSGQRSDFCGAGLCEEHHQGGSGVHGLSARRFCAIYRVPGEIEHGLLQWAIEDVTKLLLREGGLKHG